MIAVQVRPVGHCYDCELKQLIKQSAVRMF